MKLASPPCVPALGGGAGTLSTLPCSCLGQVSEMQRLDAQVKELVLKAAVEAERLVAGKLKKDTYIALGSITMNKVSGGDVIPVELFQILKDDAVKALHSVC